MGGKDIYTFLSRILIPKKIHNRSWKAFE